MTCQENIFTHLINIFNKERISARAAFARRIGCLIAPGREFRFIMSPYSVRNDKSRFYITMSLPMAVGT